MTCIFYDKTKETSNVYEEHEYIRKRKLEINDYEVFNNKDKNKVYIIHKMGEDISSRFDKLDSDIQTLKHQQLEDKQEIKLLKTEVRNLQGKDQNIEINHILGQCISKYLFNKIIQDLINNGQNIHDYHNWRNIPNNVYLNYGIDKIKLIELKDARDNQCYPEPPDINKLIVHYINQPDQFLVYNIVNVFYDTRTSSFK